MSGSLAQWLLGGGLLTVIAALIKFFFTYKTDKKKAQLENKLKEIELEQKAIDIAEDIAEQLRKRTTELEKEKAEMRLSLEIAAVEIKRLTKLVNYYGWLREKVFVLDDNKMVTQSFAHYFSNITVLECHTYNDVEKFIVDANNNKPLILIIDHELGEVTGRQILDWLTYEPEVIIMSAHKDVKWLYEGKNVEFYYKDDLYILDIAREVVRHLFEMVKDKK